MLRKVFVLGSAAAFYISACVSCQVPRSAPQAATAEMEAVDTVIQECPPTPQSAAMACPTAAPPQATKYIPRTAAISSSNLTLRSGPSVAHAVLGSYQQGEEVLILGRAAGGSWVAVSAPGGRLGWMYSPYLGIEPSDRLDDVAELEATESWVILGRVVDDSDEPVANVAVSVDFDGGPAYADFTDDSGSFALYAPSATEGPFTIEIRGVSCASRVADADCRLSDHVLRNPRVVYQPGQSPPLEFVYEATAMRLQGTVVDAAGNPSGRTGVFATRFDGAYVTGITGDDGSFTIPITSGQWTLHAARGSRQVIEIPPEGYTEELRLLSGSN